MGYDNSNYFSTVFSKIVRLSPKQYRQYCIDTGASTLAAPQVILTPAQSASAPSGTDT